MLDARSRRIQRAPGKVIHRWNLLKRWKARSTGVHASLQREAYRRSNTEMAMGHAHESVLYRAVFSLHSQRKELEMEMEMPAGIKSNTSCENWHVVEAARARTSCAHGLCCSVAVQVMS